MNRWGKLKKKKKMKCNCNVHVIQSIPETTCNETSYGVKKLSHM